MIKDVLIAHAKGEESLAEELAKPLREAGYDVTHEGTVLIGESVVEEASQILNKGGPVILCGTSRAVGSKWARKLVEAAHGRNIRVYAVQMEEEADVEALSFDGKIADYWLDKDTAKRDLLSALLRHYPLTDEGVLVQQFDDAEQRYRALLLETCDIVSLANLPEQDRNLIQRQLELRRLYVPLRVWIETESGKDNEVSQWDSLEKRRSATLISLTKLEDMNRNRQRVLEPCRNRFRRAGGWQRSR